MRPCFYGIHTKSVFRIYVLRYFVF